MASPPAIVRLYDAFEVGFGKPSITLNNGIYHNKRGYHNKPTNLPTSDYSLQHPRDKAGAKINPNYGSAIDINFEDARLRSDFRNIALVSNRLFVASRNNDPRLTGALREWFGNADLDRTVEGWTFWNSRTGQAGPATSDSTHVWHIHLSFWRDVCNNWDAIKGVVDVMLGIPINQPEDDMFTEADRDKIEWIFSNMSRIGSLREKDAKGGQVFRSAGYLLAHTDRNAFDVKAILQQKVLPALTAEQSRDAAEALMTQQMRTAIDQLRGELDGELSDTDIQRLSQALVAGLVGAVVEPAAADETGETQ